MTREKRVTPRPKEKDVLVDYTDPAEIGVLRMGVTREPMEHPWDTGIGQREATPEEKACVSERASQAGRERAALDRRDDIHDENLPDEDAVEEE